MGKINVLSFDIANLIAAGEVVDRPSSVVKELCENSIDAGATAVTVEIKHGGITMIRVSDNGCGIEPDDLPLTVLRHATSKIATAEDLSRIGTLGFRGEALAAIAAVTKLKIYSRTPRSDMGCVMHCQGGEITDITETGCALGTTVVASELFYNVPARRKFLKKDVTEGAAVTAVMEKMALSSPGVSIKYICDGEVRFMTGGDGDLKGAIYSVFGKETARRMTPVDRTDINGIRVHGYTGEPDLIKANKNSENFFINGRFVKSRTAMAAIEQAYSTRIPSQRFPVCVLNIELNPEIVDVNVHPSKLEVKFANERVVFEAIYYAVLNALQTSDSRPELYFGVPVPKGGRQEKSSSSSKSSQNSVISSASGSSSFAAGWHSANTGSKSEPAYLKKAERIQPDRIENKSADLEGLDRPYTTEKAELPPALGARRYGQRPESSVLPRAESAFVPVESSPLDRPDKAQIKIREEDTETLEDGDNLLALSEQPPSETAKPGETPDTDSKKHSPENIEDPEASHGADENGVPDYIIIGEAYNCYVIVQLDDRIIMIDKHAAHERILFDELCRRMHEKDKHSQILMYPIKLSLSEKELLILEDFRNEICAVGFAFTVDKRRSEVTVSEIPDQISRDSASDMIEELASGLSEGVGSVEAAEAKFFEAKLYSASCKAAIKGGRVYGIEHIKWICSKLLQKPDENGAVIKTCPHGRPVAFEIKKSSIDRQFDRIK